MLWPSGILVLFILVASYYDVRYQKIPNGINISFLLAGLGLNLSTGGLQSITGTLLGFLTGLLILMLPYLWGWIGGGDVKFLAAAGVWIGPDMIIKATLLGLLLFGAAGVILLVRKKRMLFFLRQLACMLVTMRMFNIEVTERLPLAVFFSIAIFLCWAGMIH